MIGYIAAWALFGIEGLASLAGLFAPLKNRAPWENGVGVIGNVVIMLVLYLWIAGVRP